LATWLPTSRLAGEQRMKTAAVTWGAGSLTELRAAEPDFLVEEISIFDSILFDRQ
jgi:hypothetical protein